MLKRQFCICWGGKQVNPDADDRRNMQMITAGPFQDRVEAAVWTSEFTRLVVGDGHSIIIEDLSITEEYGPNLTPEEIWKKVKGIRRVS